MCLTRPQPPYLFNICIHPYLEANFLNPPTYPSCGRHKSIFPSLIVTKLKGIWNKYANTETNKIT